jgi:hypothetical protein
VQRRFQFFLGDELIMRFRTVFVLSVAIVAALPLTAQTAASSDPPAAAQSATHPRRPMPKPTNLQVLPKDISGPDLIALMRGYTKALGVECEFCHAAGAKPRQLNFASDAKPEKATARTMITMTQDINAKYLATVNDPDATPAEKTVTCGTCHRGRSMPAPFAPSATDGQHPAAPPKSE